jgi:hypothetical protein
MERSLSILISSLSPQTILLSMYLKVLRNQDNKYPEEREHKEEERGTTEEVIIT